MSRLVRNIGYNLTGQLVLLVLGLTSARYIYAELGKDVLGIIYFTLMVNAIVVAVLELGITTTTVKEIAARHETDAPYVRRLIRTGSAMYWLGYVLAAVVVFAAAPSFVDRWIEVEHLARTQAILLVRLLGCSTLLVLPATFYVSVFRGVQRMGVTNTVDVAVTVTQQAVTIAIISLTRDVIWVALWIAIVAVLRLGILAMLVARLYGAGTLVPRIDREIVRANKSFALPMLVVTLLGMVHTQADKFLISWLLPVGSIGVYGLVFGTIARGGLLTSAVAQGAFPALSELAKGDRAPLLEKYHRLHDLLSYGLVPVYAGFAFAARPMFAAVFGDAMAVDLVLPASLLALGYYLNGTLTIPYFLCLSSNRPDIAARQNVAALFTTLPVTVVLTWQLGIPGAAASWVWYQLFAYVFSMPRVCREVIDIPPARWFAHVGIILGTVAATYGLAAVVLAVLGAHSTPALVVAYLVATAAFLVASTRTMRPDSRTAAREVVRRALRR